MAIRNAVRYLTIATALFATQLFTSSLPGWARSAPTSRPISQSIALLPIRFEPNKGQCSNDVRYIARGLGHSLYFTDNEAVVVVPERHGKTVEGSALRFQLSGADATAQPIGIDKMPTRANYFIGSDPKKWRTDIPAYSRIKYAKIYPGIDLIYYGKQGRLEHDFIVSPWADPKRIKLKVVGAKSISVDKNGDVQIKTRFGVVRQRKPVVYQRTCGKMHLVPGEYITNRNYLSFKLGRYDKSKPLVIDPVLCYMSEYGGSADDRGRGIALDNNGNAYITGYTNSTDFPTINPYQATRGGGSDIIVMKFNIETGIVTYATYIGGTGSDSANGIAVDSTGNAYITGYTYSANYPYVNPIPSLTGALLTKLNAAGNALTYSTRVGGSQGYGVRVDQYGNAYVAGSAPSSRAFVAKINPSGSAVTYTAYLAGTSGATVALALDVDPSGSAYITGYTLSTTLPVLNAAQPVIGGGRDSFVAKFKPDGSGLDYCTYLGGSANESESAVAGIVVDSSGCAIVTGDTKSTNFPTIDAIQPAALGNSDAYLTKISADGIAFLFSTYLGGSGIDMGRSVTVDSRDNIYVCGVTSSDDFPKVHNVQDITGWGNDAFVTAYSNDGSHYLYSTYLGGMDQDGAWSIAADSEDSVYITGEHQLYNPYNVLYARLDPLTVFDVAPNSSINNAPVTVDIHGLGFKDGANVNLTRSGFSDISGESPIVAPGGESINVTFNITGKTRGAWDVIVTNPDGKSATLADGFTISPLGVADLEMAKFNGRSHNIAQVIMQYVLLVTNKGPGDADGVTVTDPIPAGLVFIGATPSQGSFTPVGDTIVWDVGNIQGGEYAFIMIDVISANPRTVVNTATVTGTDIDPDPGNNTDSVTTIIGPPQPSALELVSITDSGEQGYADSYECSISDDGEHAAFRSLAGNLVPDDTNEKWDVFVKDMVTEQVERVSVGAGGEQADQDCGYPAISGNGRYVAFDGWADNLVPGATDFKLRVFVHDRTTGQTVQASLNSSGEMNDADARAPSISADGRYVVFESLATNLAFGDGNNTWDCFLRDMITGATTLISHNPSGSAGNSDSRYPFISSNGASVVFTSAASDLVADDNNDARDIFLYNVQTQAISRVTLGLGGQETNGDSYQPAISADGHYVIFPSVATNIVENDTNDLQDIFVHDLQTQANVRVNISSSGAQAEDFSGEPWLPEEALQWTYLSVSQDGLKAVFPSWAGNLVPNDTNGYNDVFVRDLEHGTTSRVSGYSASLESNNQSSDPSMTPDGNYIVFGSLASNLVKWDTNNALDIFYYSMGADLLIEKIASPSPAILGLDLTYTITIRNAGPQGATNVIVTDNLPPGISFISASASQGTCSQSGGVVTCQIGSLAMNATATVTVRTKPSAIGTLTNTATVTGIEQDPLKDNNTTTISTMANLPGINCGGPAAGTWIADTGFTGGRILFNPKTVSNIGSVPLMVYQTQRYGKFTYNFPQIPNGTYKIRLHFVENYYTKAKMRLFDVYIEGKPVLTKFDVFAAAGGQYKGIVKEFTTTVSDRNGLQFTFTPRNVDAIVSGIEILGL